MSGILNTNARVVKINNTAINESVQYDTVDGTSPTKVNHKLKGKGTIKNKENEEVKDLPNNSWRSNHQEISSSDESSLDSESNSSNNSSVCYFDDSSEDYCDCSCSCCSSSSSHLTSSSSSNSSLSSSISTSNSSFSDDTSSEYSTSDTN
uniref:Uncharacterized protein n=1 Tax=Clastoptera arizonana TaxID=38151 RepID=A0A1B6DFI1_9HEMI